MPLKDETIVGNAEICDIRQHSRLGNSFGSSVQQLIENSNPKTRQTMKIAVHLRWAAAPSEPMLFTTQNAGLLNHGKQGDQSQGLSIGR